MPKQHMRSHFVSKPHGIGLHLVHHLPQLAPHSSWLELLPSRLGHQSAVDNAVTTLVKALDFHFGGRSDRSSSEAAFLSYGKTLKLLRTALSCPKEASSECTVISIAVLAMFEVVMRESFHDRFQDVYSHCSAISAVFRCRTNTREMSDIAKALFLNSGSSTFGVHMARGVPSDLESEHWISLDTDSLHSMSDSVLRLRKISSQILLHRPRLIAHVRRLRTEETASPEVVASTMQLSQHMAELRNDKIESDILHRVKVHQTQETASRSIVTYSYQFRNADDFCAAISYWANRCATINLCLKIVQVLPPSRTVFSIDDLKSEKHRMAANLMMSWEYASSIGPFATHSLSKCFIHNWQELRRANEFRGMDSGEIRSWLIPKINHPFMEWLPNNCSEGDLDVAADFLVGGPADGFIAEL